MEKCGNLFGVCAVQACSACAGDYEDPDRTAGEDFEDLLEEHEEQFGNALTEVQSEYGLGKQGE